MKKILFVFGLLLISLLTYSQGKTPPEWPAATTITSADLFLLWQSGALKNLPYSYLGGAINDTADVLRSELATNWNDDIADTATVLRAEMGGGTADTAFTKSGDNYVILKNIGDSVGVGNASPSEKFHVTGKIQAIAAIFDNGYENLLIGDSAGIALTSGGIDNIFIGTDAGRSATSGDYNIFLGYQAGRDMQTSSNNIAIGYQALLDGSVGGNNVVIGNSVASAATFAGAHSVLLGYYAGKNITSANYNIFIGALAGDAITTSGLNVAVGYTALSSQNTETGATAIGSYAGQDATGATLLTAVGYQALRNVTTGDDNTGIGANAGDLLTTGSNNVLLGDFAGAALTTQSGNTMIGHEAGKSSTVSNQLFIDNSEDATPLIWGDFAADSLVVNGDLTGTERLHIVDETVSQSADYFAIKNSHTKTAGTTDYNHELYGTFNRITLNHANSAIGGFSGLYNTAILTDGQIGSVGNVKNAFGIQNVLDLNDGTITNDAFGFYNQIDQETADSVDGDIYGDYIDIDADGENGGTVYMEYLEEGDGVDYGIYQNGTAPNHFGGSIEAVSLAASGIITGEPLIALHTAAAVIFSDLDSCRGSVHINNDANPIDFTLPPAELGLGMLFHDRGGAVITIDVADGTDSIELDGASVGSGDAIDSPGNAGNFIYLLAISNSTWISLGRSGTWVDGGAD